MASGEGWRSSQLSEKSGAEPLSVMGKALIAFINNVH